MTTWYSENAEAESAELVSMWRGAGGRNIRWVDSHEAAAILDATPDLACDLARRGLIPGEKRCGRWRFPAEKLYVIHQQHEVISIAELNRADS